MSGFALCNIKKMYDRKILLLYTIWLEIMMGIKLDEIPSKLPFKKYDEFLI